MLSSMRLERDTDGRRENSCSSSPSSSPPPVELQTSINRKSQSTAATLSALSKQELLKRDVFGRTILHLLILSNRYDLMKRLFKNPEIRTILTLVDYENGWNCMHYVIFHKRLMCFKSIMEHLKSYSISSTLTVANNSTLFDLLRTKDRNRLTPLQLLDNDFKDLMWVPTYINEKNEFHLNYRFEAFHNDESEVSGDQQQGQQPQPAGGAEVQPNVTAPVPAPIQTQNPPAQVPATHNTTQDPPQSQPSLKQIQKSQASIRDNEDWWQVTRGGSDLVVFGSNKNNNLGLGDSSDRPVPSRVPLEYFQDTTSCSRIQEILCKARFLELDICKYHSIALTNEGELYTCGIGSRGKLGHGVDDTSNCYRFKKIEFFSETEEEPAKSISKFATANSHTIALTKDNELYAWGINTQGQLGVSTISSLSTNSNSNANSSEQVEIFEASPKRIISRELKKNSTPFKGVAVSTIHSLAYTKNEIYFWGLSVGQMGAITDPGAIPGERRRQSIVHKGFLQTIPKKITLRDNIKFVSTCETCTCIVTSKDDIQVYYQNQHIKLPKILPKSNTNDNFDLFKPRALTKAIEIKKVCMRSHGFIVFLLDTGDVVSVNLASSEFEDYASSKGSKNLRYITLWKAHSYDLAAIDIDVSNEGSLLLCTRNGSVFLKQSNNGSSTSRKNSMSDATLNIPLRSKFKKIDNINKVVRVSCDDNFVSFGFIRDEIDPLPVKLHKNSFVNDMKYLQSFQESDLYRKQNELFSSDGPGNSYVSDFIYPKKEHKRKNDMFDFSKRFHDLHVDDDEDIEEEHTSEDKQEKNLKDTLHTTHQNRFDSKKYKETAPKHTYQLVPNSDRMVVLEEVKSDMSYLLHKYSNIDEAKHYDCFIKLEEYPDISIGVHKYILEVRSPSFCGKIFNPKNPGEFFKHEGLQGRFDPDTNYLHFTTHLDLKALIVFIYFLYTNDVLSIWSEYPVGINCPPEIKDLKASFDKLVSLFGVADVFGKLSKDEVYLKKMRNLLEEEDDEANERSEKDLNQDVMVILKDGEVKCHSAILVARSAYFETILSNRWEIRNEKAKCKIVRLENITKSQFHVILRHLYGFSNNTIFDSFTEDIQGINECDEFVNSMLELIEISDELLLFDLKSLCEVAIKEFISTDNVLLLLMHADLLSAQKLFMNCSWFIFNNLEVLLLDQAFKEIQFELLRKLEKQIRFLDNCKRSDFSDTQGSLNEFYQGNWIEKQSNVLISNFLFKMDDYNENFMSDKKGHELFEPLFDLRKDQEKSGGTISEPKKKVKEKRAPSVSFRVESNGSASGTDFQSGLLAFRNAYSGRNNSASGSSSMSMSMSTSAQSLTSAIDDNDEEFETVSSTRRRKSSKNCGEVIPSERKSFSSNSNIIVRNPDEKPLVRSSSNSTSNTGLSPHSNWASPGSSNGNSSILKDQPILSKRGTEEPRKMSSKAKVVSAPRLSQKERKKMAQFDNSSETTTNIPSSSGASAPWSTPNSSTSSLNRSSNSSYSNLPTLGSQDKRSQKSKMPRSSPPLVSNVSQSRSIPLQSSGPSLTEIMIQESLKIEEQQIREKERKSLQEIQQEQEFAKWWSEETAKVQQSMANSSINEGNNSGSSSNSKRNKKRGKKLI
ncbi:hypothetical protein CAAN3_07S06634 [[Candida] anglica]